MINSNVRAAFKIGEPVTKILRLAVILAVTMASLLGATSVASAAPPRLTPKQQQALCVVKESARLLATINKQAWSDRKAKEAAIRAIPAKATAACPLGGTTPTVPPATRPAITGPAPSPQNGQTSSTVSVAAAANNLTTTTSDPCGDRNAVLIGLSSTLPSGVTAHGSVNSDGSVGLQVRNTTGAAVDVGFTVICAAPSPQVPPGTLPAVTTPAPTPEAGQTAVAVTVAAEANKLTTTTVDPCKDGKAVAIGVDTTSSGVTVFGSINADGSVSLQLRNTNQAAADVRLTVNCRPATPTVPPSTQPPLKTGALFPQRGQTIADFSVSAPAQALTPSTVRPCADGQIIADVAASNVPSGITINGSVSEDGRTLSVEVRNTTDSTASISVRALCKLPTGTVTTYTFSDPDFPDVQPGGAYSSTIGCDAQGERPGPDRLLGVEYNDGPTFEQLGGTRSFTGLDGYTVEYVQFTVRNTTATSQPVRPVVRCENTAA